MRRPIREWLIERYGDVAAAAWWSEYGDAPIVLDAGCGAGLAAVELLAARLHSVRYVGMDVSTAVDVAARRFAERNLPGGFLQADLAEPPFADESLDVVLSEGVLHHTDSTEGALKRLAQLLRPGGRFLLYVYRRKGPIREFTDDYVRDRLQALEPKEAWARLLPLTRLGQALGDLHVEIEVPEDVDLLGIPAGRIDVQRLFYWHVCKAYHRDDLDLEELNHINFDWYAPRNAHRQSPEEVRAWCLEAGLEVERENVQDAGITIVARKTS
jgi:SAM-dependent methyltransferase